MRGSVRGPVEGVISGDPLFLYIIPRRMTSSKGSKSVVGKWHIVVPSPDLSDIPRQSRLD
jgi:hypothetical protein